MKPPALFGKIARQLKHWLARPPRYRHPHTNELKTEIERGKAMRGGGMP